MARTRNIKPAFFLNDELAELPALARLLFIGLWCIADRDGYLEDKPNKIKAEILPYDNCDVNELLDKLNEKFIKRYSLGEKKYIFIINFSKHQNPHLKEKPSEIPRFNTITEFNNDSTVLAPDKKGTNPSLNLKPYTLNPIPTTENLKPVSDSCVDGLHANDSCVDDLQAVVDFYNNNIGLITPYGLELLSSYAEDMSTNLIILALKKAVEADKRTIKYIKGILNNWAKKGIKTVIEAEKEDKQFRKEAKKENNSNKRDYSTFNLENLYANKGG